jgi:hypothetical protein
MEFRVPSLTVLLRTSLLSLLRLDELLILGRLRSLPLLYNYWAVTGAILNYLRRTASARRYLVLSVRESGRRRRPHGATQFALFSEDIGQLEAYLLSLVRFVARGVVIADAACLVI